LQDVVKDSGFGGALKVMITFAECVGLLFASFNSKDKSMKKILFAILLSAGLMMGASAQEVKENDVPTAVKTNFKTAFPNAKDVDWKTKEGNYKAAFKINGSDYIASFSADGKILSKGLKIRRSELPTAVLTAVKSAYADKTIEDVYRMDKNGAAFYLIKLDGNPDTNVLYTPDGQVAKEKLD
jgi:hypothetical protein